MIRRRFRREEAAPVCGPEPGSPWPRKSEPKDKFLDRREGKIANDRTEQHHPVDEARSFLGSPKRRAGCERVAHDHSWPGSQLSEDGDGVAAYRSRGVIRPFRRRLAEPADVHRHHSASRMLQHGFDEAILRSQVTHSRDAHDERSRSARIVEGYPTALCLKKLGLHIVRRHETIRSVEQQAYRLTSKRNHARRSASSVQVSIRPEVALSLASSATSFARRSDSTM